MHLTVVRFQYGMKRPALSIDSGNVPKAGGRHAIFIVTLIFLRPYFQWFCGKRYKFLIIFSLFGVEFCGCYVSLWCMTNRNDIEQLFKAHYAQMFRLAVALLHDDDFARDIVHDVFASLLDSPLDMIVTGGYLTKAVRNRCLNHIRDCEIHQRIAYRYFFENEEYESEDWPDDETIERIYGLIKSEISPQATRVMELRFSDGLPFARIAVVMGISETAVYRHLSHALKIIRKNLNENG